MCNGCIEIIGLPLLQRYFDTLKQNSKPIVSVGSGIGTVEKYLDVNDSVICVDPDPFSYQIFELEPELSHLPDYEYVEDLIKDNPGLVSNCNIFLNWPNPTIGKNECTFDIESIELLKPEILLIVMERTGGAGSYALAGSIMSLIPIFDNKTIPEKYHYLPNLENYNLLWHTSSIDCFTSDDKYIFSYLLLVRKDVNIKPVSYTHLTLPTTPYV